MLLEGLHIPLTTPFHSDGRLFTHKLESNVARYSKTPAAGLVVLGPSGEPTLLSDDETRDALSTAADSAAPEKVLVAGISRDSVIATLALADFAATLDYDAILLPVPSVLSDTGDLAEQSPSRVRELLTYFQTVADRSPLPIVLLSSATRRISVDAIAELAAHPHIIGLLDTEARPSGIAAMLQRTAAIKHEVSVTSIFAAVTARMSKAAAATRTSGDFISVDTLAEALSGSLPAIDTGASTALLAAPPVHFPYPESSGSASINTSLRTRIKSVGFQILAGNTSGLLDALRAGASAIAPTFAACAPQVCYEVFAAWKDQDQPLAEEKQTRLLAAAHLAEDVLGPGGIKLACDLNGYFGGMPRLPLLPPSGEHRAELERLMKPLRN